ncbi:MAG: hypothetical protein AB7I59_22280 [Geminicoccaceae bacterium]
MYERMLGLAAVAMLAGVGVAAAHARAKSKIMAYHAANAREGDGNCGPGHISDIADTKVIEASGDKVVLAVNYPYSARAEAHPTACTGTSQRELTLAKAGSAYEVTGMTGNTP